MPLDPEPEVLGDLDGELQLPSILMCGSSHRCPQGLWDAKLAQYTGKDDEYGSNHGDVFATPGREDGLSSTPSRPARRPSGRASRHGKNGAGRRGEDSTYQSKRRRSFSAIVASSWRAAELKKNSVIPMSGGELDPFTGLPTRVAFDEEEEEEEEEEAEESTSAPFGFRTSMHFSGPQAYRVPIEVLAAASHILITAHR